MSRRATLAALGSLFAASLVTLSPPLTESASAGCAPNERISVQQTGSPTYASIGSAVGKYNASSTTSNLSYSMYKSTSRSTAWTATAKASISWGIAQVEASFAYTVTKTTTTGTTVTNTMNVPGHYYGYMQPKVEYRYFWIRDVENRPDCSLHVIEDYGTLKSITAYPFFAECVSTSPCTPKP